MKKLTFLMALLLFSIGTMVKAQDYSVNNPTGTKKNTNRAVTSIKLNSPKFGLQTATTGNSGRNLYDDLTSTVFKAYAGETLTATFTYSDSWMNGYVYIDLDNDGFTAGVNSSTHAPTGDLMTYSFYSGNDNDDSSGYNSLGYNTDIECSKHYSGYVFYNSIIIDGAGYQWTTEKGDTVVGMPTHDGTSTMIGNSGNGYAKITYLGK